MNNINISEPLKAFIESISNAIGKWYEPIYRKRIAKATEEAIQLRIDTMKKNPNFIIEDKVSNFSVDYKSIDNNSSEEFIKRTFERLLHQETIKQNNIESIVYGTYKNLENDKEFLNSNTKKVLDQDWTSQFFDSVKNISNEDMQKIWINILTNETKKPNTFSYRTLEVLKNMSQQEALIFEKVASFSIKNDNTYFIIENDFSSLFNIYPDISYNNLLLLEEIGLINSNLLTYSVSKFKEIRFSNKNIIATIKPKKKDSNVKLELPAYKFTEIASQLMNVIQINSNEKYFINTFRNLEKKNRNLIVEIKELIQK